MLNAVIQNDLILSVAALSALSGVASFFQAYRTGRREANCLNLVAEIIVAQTVGMAVGYFMISKNFDESMICAVTLIASNNGTEKLAWVDEAIKARRKQIAEKVFGVPPERKQ